MIEFVKQKASMVARESHVASEARRASLYCMRAVLKDNQSEDRVVATGDPGVYQSKGQVFVERCR